MMKELKPDQNRFADWLDQKLEESELDLTSVASGAAMSQSYLSMLRRGKKNNPAPEKVVQLARVFGVDAQEALDAAKIGLPTAPSPCAKPNRPSWRFKFDLESCTVQFELSPDTSNDNMHTVGISVDRREKGVSTIRRKLPAGESFEFSPDPTQKPIRCTIDTTNNELSLRIPLGEES